MNKKQAIDAHMGCIKFSCERRNVEQYVKNGRWELEQFCEWFVDYEYSSDYRDVWGDKIYFHVRDEAQDSFAHQYDCSSVIDIMGGYWSFAAPTKLTVNVVIARVQNSYRKALGRMHWCKKHQTFSASIGGNGKGYCDECADEDF